MTSVRGGLQLHGGNAKIITVLTTRNRSLSTSAHCIWYQSCQGKQYSQALCGTVLHSHGEETEQDHFNSGDFPGGPMVKNLPANAEDMGTISGPGRFHMSWATKPLCHNYWAHPPEPTCHNYWSLHALGPVFHNKRRHCNEKPEHHNKE